MKNPSIPKIPILLKFLLIYLTIIFSISLFTFSRSNFLLYTNWIDIKKYQLEDFIFWFIPLPFSILGLVGVYKITTVNKRGVYYVIISLIVLSIITKITIILVTRGFAKYYPILDLVIIIALIHLYNSSFEPGSLSSRVNNKIRNIFIRNKQ